MTQSVPVLLADMAARFKVTLPTDTKKKGTADEYAGAALATQYGKSPWFRPSDDGKGIAFRAPVNGVPTSGSKNPRAELRELDDAGKGAAWSSSSGYHEFEVHEAFNHLPNDTEALVGAQIHDSKNDISVFRLEGTKLWITKSNDDNYALADANYQLGTPYEARFTVWDDTIQAFYNGQLVCTIAGAFSGAYFKGGAYTQGNPSNSQPANETNFGETVIYDIAVSHTDQPPATTPIDPPAGQAPVIMVIRHGEKDDNADGVDDNPHALSARGVLRSLAIRDQGLFITPRADLYQPGYVFASGPPPTRMVDTAQPTAAALKLPIDASLDTENAIDATAKLLVAKAKAGLVVWAVLEHSAIPDTLKAVAEVLGTEDATPSEHADDDFTTGYKFEGTQFSTFQESVLPGDPGYVAPVPGPPAQPDPPVVVPDPPVTEPNPPVVPDPPVTEPMPPVVPDPPVSDPSPPTAPTPAEKSWWQRFLDWLFG